MSETRLVFEKVGDLRTTYPFLCVYDDRDQLNPFMEIAVTDDKKLKYTIYASNRDVVLTASEWETIHKKAIDFLPRVIANEENYQRLKKGWIE